SPRHRARARRRRATCHLTIPDTGRVAGRTLCPCPTTEIRGPEPPAEVARRPARIFPGRLPARSHRHRAQLHPALTQPRGAGVLPAGAHPSCCFPFEPCSYDPLLLGHVAPQTLKFFRSQIPKQVAGDRFVFDREPRLLYVLQIVVGERRGAEAVLEIE